MNNLLALLSFCFILCSICYLLSCYLYQSYGGYDQDNAWVGPYVERLTHITAETYCGLRISKPNANDTGKQIEKQTDRQKERQRQTKTDKDRQIDKQKKTDRKKDRQIDRCDYV